MPTDFTIQVLRICGPGLLLVSGCAGLGQPVCGGPAAAVPRAESPAAQAPQVAVPAEKAAVNREVRPSPPPATAPVEPVTKPATPAANVPPKPAAPVEPANNNGKQEVAAAPTVKPAPSAAKPAAPPVPKADPAPAPKPTLDLASLEKRLKDTSAIGLMTKLTLKNQVDELLERFRAHYDGRVKTTLAQLRQPYDMLILKVLSLLQDGDPSLAKAVADSREAIWGILSDPGKFRNL